MSDDEYRVVNSSFDWRYAAYLNRVNWPECIPWTGPKREYGPYPWSRPDHDDPHDLDEYPHMHPDAGSIGEMYMGDVCPYCGVPVKWDAEVVLITGAKGTLHEVDTMADPTPAYHSDCWHEREQEKQEHVPTLNHYE